MGTSIPRARRSQCPINIALEIFGDSWSLLVIRDLLFNGQRTFNEFQKSAERIASNVLADRLVRLESAGIIIKSENASDARRYDYRLTEKGLALAPVLIEIIVWSAQHEDAGAPASAAREMNSQRKKFLALLRKKQPAKRP
jgi:DNA-binding HxlR family transcriptional regulator